MNPRLSANAFLNGPFDFNRRPLSPLGTKTIVHEKPNQRGTWDAHGVDGWYIRLVPDHYRCYEIHITASRASRIADTVEFFPTTCAIPAPSSADAALEAATDLITALENPAPAAPFAPVGATQLAALRVLTGILSFALHEPTSTKKLPSSEPSGPMKPPPDSSPPRVAPTATPDATSPRVEHRYPTRGCPNGKHQPH
jgi:hypothetical protein